MSSFGGSPAPKIGVGNVGLIWGRLGCSFMAGRHRKDFIRVDNIRLGIGNKKATKNPRHLKLPDAVFKEVDGTVVSVVGNILFDDTIPVPVALGYGREVQAPS